MTDPTPHSTPRPDPLAELDRRGRRAALALHTALAAAPTEWPAGRPDTVTPDLLPSLPFADSEDSRAGAHEVFPLERRAAASVPRHHRRVLAAAAAGILVAGGVAVALSRSDGDDVRSQTPAAPTTPTADIGAAGTGIRPPEGHWSGFTIAGEGPGPGWQWTGVLPGLGTDLVFGLDNEVVRVAYVLEDIGGSPLQVAATSARGVLPDGQVALYGVVAGEVSATDGTVTVEAPGAEPIAAQVVDTDTDATNAPDTPTHDLVTAWLPADVSPDAEVVARAGDGTEVGRVPLGWTGEDPEHDRTGSVYPEGVDALTAGVLTVQEDGVQGGIEVAEGGRNVLLTVSGHEDQADTVLTAPGLEPVQALATFLDGEGPGTAVVYGLAPADATSVRVEPVGGEAEELPVSSIDGATQWAFGGTLPRDGLDGAQVVAYAADGTELGRSALAWTRHDVVVRPGTLPGG